MKEKRRPTKLRIEEDWFSFYLGVGLGLLVLLGVIRHIPW